MSTENGNIQQALNDVALIRRILDQRTASNDESSPNGTPLATSLLLQVLATLGALALLLVELTGGNTLSQTLLGTGDSRELASYGSGLIGLILVGLLLVSYFIFWRSARHEGDALADYIARHFRPMKNLALVSDLLMKYAALSLLLLAGQPQWIAPLLLAFTGDYLLQGRLFTLPLRSSLTLGLLCLAGAGWMLMQQHALLVYPLVVFVLIGALSSTRLFLRQRHTRQLLAQEV